MANQAYHVCFHCKNRKIGCHATCEMYKKEVEENTRRKKEYNLKNTFAKAEFRCKTLKGAKYLKSQNHKK